MIKQPLSSREEIIGQMSKQVNLGKCADVAYSALKRRDYQIAIAKIGLKRDLLWNMVGNLKAESESCKKAIARCVEEWFPICDDFYPEDD